jgi:hypothetical protein
MLGRGSPSNTLIELIQRVGPSSPIVLAVEKAAVSPMGVVSGELRLFGDSFIRGPVAARAAYDGLNFPSAPPSIRVGILNTSTLIASWVVEGQPIPVGRQDVDYETLRLRKLGLIVVTTAEAAREPEAISTVERLLAASLAVGTDTAAFDPNVSGSLTNGATEVTATGNASIDVALVLGAISGGVPSRPCLVFGAAAARAALFSGDPIFSNVGLAGPGSIGTLPTFTSPSPAIAGLAIAVDKDSVLVADGGIEIESGGEAQLRMDDVPANQAPTISLWQKNLVSLRAIRYLDWQRRTDAIAFTSIAPITSP